MYTDKQIKKYLPKIVIKYPCYKCNNKNNCITACKQLKRYCLYNLSNKK